MFLSDLKMKLQFCIYVLLSKKDNKFYIGYTSNLKQRLTSHFNGESAATAPRRPFDLIFCEYFLSKSDALRREKYLKTTSGKKGLKLIIRESLDALSK
ncbi:MAG: GIY-YIG nuclease family protein [Candidatus Daviesbacteria bacterium]|nr:GIY-YIG nuclease family protein [Candidatus Daviesbacteria bacterium]